MGFTEIQENMKHLKVCHAEEKSSFLKMAAQWHSGVFCQLYYIFIGGLLSPDIEKTKVRLYFVAAFVLLLPH